MESHFKLASLENMMVDGARSSVRKRFGLVSKRCWSLDPGA